MTRAFVIRPFGTKEGVDFERTQRELIGPVLQELGISGGEATQIVAAGNIRALITGESELGTYDPFPPAIVVPLGPDGGSGQLPGAEQIASRETVSEIKGRHLMVEPVATGLGLETAKAT